MPISPNTFAPRSFRGRPLDRAALIALNAEPRLPRATVASLTAGDFRWWREENRALDLAKGSAPLPAAQLATVHGALGRAVDVAAEQQSLAQSAGAEIVTLLDESYPARLRDLDLPPPVLYVRGAIPDAPALAVVGSRRASAYGRDVAHGLAAALAERGMTIVSGFARGIDSAAHRAAAAAPHGATVAFLGCGIDVDYPRGRTALRETVADAGALVSEFPCGAPPRPFHFPIRNRLIAAFGDCGTLVVEATARSGSLITARLALDLGRHVHAVPGRIFDRRAHGPNALIRDGAFLVQHPADLWITLDEEQRSALPDLDVDRDRGRNADPDSGDATAAAKLPDDQRQVLAVIPTGARLSIEQLVVAAGLHAARVQSALLELELAGRVRRHPGPAFSRGGIW